MDTATQSRPAHVQPRRRGARAAAPIAPAALDRLLWRAGLGPSPADRARFGRRGLDATVEALLTPPKAMFAGAQLQYTTDSGLAPIDVVSDGPDAWAQEVLWWLDLMVRTRAPLVERMTLNLHDHFATSMEKVNDRRAMIAQNVLLRRNALGNFGKLCRLLMRDRAMQQWLDLVNSSKDAPNENFARELMELFTVGLVYSGRDVSEMARALTGFTFDWDTKRYGFDPSQHDAGMKTIFGQRGRWTPDDAVRLCVAHRAHPAFLCTKLWGYFVPTPPPRRVLRQLTQAYVASGFELKPVLRLILHAPQLYSNLDQPDMVKPPVVFLAGMLRSVGVDRLDGGFRWLLDGMGQQPFFPPNVAGWDQNEAFLTTGTAKARFDCTTYVLQLKQFDDSAVPATDTPEAALADALQFAGNPALTAGSMRALQAAAAAIQAEWNGDDHFAAERRRVLRHLVLAGPDAHVH